MAPGPEADFHGVMGPSGLGRRIVAALQHVSDRVPRSTSSTQGLAAASDLEMALAPRLERRSISAGGIAGAVIGSVFGVLTILLVGGFLYFRHRRTCRRHQDEFLPTKSPDDQPRSALPHRGSLLRERSAPYRGGNDVSDRSNGNYVPGPSQPQEAFQPGIDGSIPPYAAVGSPDGQTPTSPAEQAAAASYYDMTISMESDQELPMAPISKQLTDMYQEQLRQAREQRKARKGSKGSALSRLYNSIKRKRSTHEFGDTAHHKHHVPTWGHGPDVPLDSIEGTGSVRGVPSMGFGGGRGSMEGPAGGPPIFDEPQQMSDRSEPAIHKDKRSKQHGPSQDSLGTVPHRLDSWNTELNKANYDPQLPSSVLVRTSTASSTDMFGPHARQTSGTIPRADARTRLKSPDIPEPMEVETMGAPPEAESSALRQSHSPPAEQESFNPMMFMKPTTDTEKAAYVNAELDRIEKSASASPPTISPSPPATADDAPEADADGDDDYSDEDMDSEDDADQTLAPPGQRQSGHPQMDGPSDSSTTPAHTSTEPSSARTPDTGMTSSLTPSTQVDGKTTSSASPETISASGSPRPGYTCEECGRTFDQVHKLNHHKRYHDRKHVCPYEGCDKRFGTKTHLARHINDKHEKKKGFHCPEPTCPYYKGGKAFPRKDNWRRHMQNKHGITNQAELDAVDETTS